MYKITPWLLEALRGWDEDIRVRYSYSYIIEPVEQLEIAWSQYKNTSLIPMHVDYKLSGLTTSAQSQSAGSYRNPSLECSPQQSRYQHTGLGS